jgi:predicted NAD/FAD-dependent oxidoreductase
VGEGWTLRDATGHTHGPFDAVGVTVAALQAAPLLAAHAGFARQARDAAYAPCFALMAAFDAPLALPYDGIFVRDGALAWIARDSSKPGRAAGERWVAHASPDWAAAHLETPADALAPGLLAKLAALTGETRPPAWTSCHRWRYALPRAPLDTACLWDAGSGLGAAGDWCADGRVEGAYRSGVALAAAMLRPSSP